MIIINLKYFISNKFKFFILAFQERWLGGMYNWKTMKWIWATTGKTLTYQGFYKQNFTEDQRWHCIIMDPTENYKYVAKISLQLVEMIPNYDQKR